MKAIKHIFFFLALLIGSQALAQKTIVRGSVKDAETGETLPFVNLIFQDSKIGAVTDINGNFFLETYYATDSLVASFVGYKVLAKAVKPDIDQTIQFSLESSSTALEEVVITGSKKDENPAHVIMKRVVRNKPANNREKIEHFEYEAYNKIEFDINNVDEKFFNRKVMKPFQFVEGYVDSSEAKPFLPMFMTESLSDFYYQKNPRATKEIIKATKVSGIKNESISQFLGDMYQNVNVYDNFIRAFGKSFASPVSDFWKLSYDVYLMDSGVIDNNFCYKLVFQPKRKSELTFKGEMWINDTTYAVKKIKATLSGDANINWISEFTVEQKYDQVENEVWMLTEDKLVIDFNVADKAMGFYGRKHSSYRDFTINKPKTPEFYNDLRDIYVLDSANDVSDETWESLRHNKLTSNQKEIYQMVDTLQDIPAFKTWVDVITIIVGGYYTRGPIEIGPYSSLVSYNVIEGLRLRMGGRTSNQFSTRLELSGYAAYGLRDKAWKYHGGVRYMVSKKPRQVLSGSYTRDVEQLGLSDNAWRTDNILSSLFRRNPANRLNGYYKYDVGYNHEWVEGFSNEIILSHKKLWPLGSLNFGQDELGRNNTFTTTEVSVHTRFAYQEKFVAGEFDRISLGTKHPVLQARYTYGIPNAIGSDYEYHKLRLNVADKIIFGPVGFTQVIAEAGKIWGTLPYPLLELHNGNETYFYDPQAFNLMNFFEFVSDEYASLSLTHHFNGFFLNHIPLMKKLKWREVVVGKAVVGNLSSKNENVIPSTPFELNRPYAEAGVGIENIFKIFRVDGLWRLTYRDNPNAVPFGIRGTVQVMF